MGHLKRSITALEKKAWIGAAEPSSNYRSLLTDICAAIVVAGRPYDSYHDRRNHAPSIPDYSSVVSFAYQILTDEETQEKWIISCQAERAICSPLGEKAVYTPIFSLMKYVKNFQINDLCVNSNDSVVPALSEHPEFVKHSRFNVSSGTSDAQLLRFQVNSSLLNKMLGLPNGCIQQLVDDGVIKPCNSTNVLRDQLFDLREVSELFNQVYQPRSSDRHVSPNSKELTTHLTTYGKALSDVVSRSLNGSIPDSTNLSAIVVSDSDYREWLLQRLEDACKDAVPVHKARAALQCGEKKFREIVMQSQLKYCSYSFNDTQLDGTSFFEYLIKNSRTY